MTTYARESLGTFPTPVHSLPNVGTAIGIDLSIKRDDLSGLAAGGNKVRKLEYLLADAKSQGATMVITAGAIQSNHVLQTIAAANKCGMRAIAVLHGKRPQQPSGNFLLDEILGAEIEFLDTDQFVEEVGDYMEQRRKELAQEGEITYVVPVGGSNPVGALGYVNCVKEMAGQYASQHIEPPDYVVVATGSVGTYAGTVVGCAQYWPTARVLGIVVTTNYFAQRHLVAELTNSTAKVAGMDRSWSPDELWLTYEYIGPGYGIRSQEGDDAIHFLAKKEGVLLDPTYTGKVFAGLLGSVQTGAIPQGSRVLFIHTGGAMALLAREAIK